MQHEYLTEEEEKVLDTFVTFPVGRKSLISKLSTEHDDNWQVVETPYWVCREMIDLIPSLAESYIVFFAVEFLEVLIGERGFCGEKVLFIADNETEAAAARTMYNVKTVVFGKQSVNKDVLRDIVKGVNMKFEKVAVVGNPPFQRNNDKGGGTTHASALYNLFVESVIDGIKPNYLSFIIPSRWMVGGRGLTKFRQRMINDRRLKKIVHFPGHSDVFKSVSITGGVNYFLWEKYYNDVCEFVVGKSTTRRYLNEYDIILQDNNAQTILKKVTAISNKWMNKQFAIQSPFGLYSSFSQWSDTGVKCLSKGKKINYVNDSLFVDKFNLIDKWKVATSKATSEGNITPDKDGAKSIISNFFIIEPGAVCTQTYIIVNIFDKKEEAENFILFMKSKFFRFMLGLRMLTQDVNKEKFAWVPDIENFSKKWEDFELYSMFNLSYEEICYIEGKIKELK